MPNVSMPSVTVRTSLGGRDAPPDRDVATRPPRQVIGLGGWIRSVPRALRDLLCGAIRRRHQQLGRPLVMSDGRTFVPFRETIKDADGWNITASGAVLQARFHLRAMGPKAHVRHAIFRRLCIVTTPFFVGVTGFRSKLWLVDPASGDFAGLYEWDSAEGARAYAEGLVRVLRLLSEPGSVSYEVVAGLTVAEYLEAARLLADKRPAGAGEKEPLWTS